MWSAIGLATQHRLRVAGARLAVPLTRQTAITPVVFFRRTNISGAVIVKRGFSVSRTRLVTAAAEGTSRKKTTAVAKKPSAKKPVTKKKPVAKKPAAQRKVVAKKKKPVKVLTDKQQQALQERKLKLKIRELKRIALVGEEPKNLPHSVWSLVLKTTISSVVGGPGRGLIGEKSTEAAQTYKDLSPEERGHLEGQARQNRLANEAAYRAWVESKSPHEILVANTARKALKRLDVNKNSVRPIKDDRIPKKPGQAFSFFMKSQWESGAYDGVLPSDAMKRCFTEFAALSESDKKIFTDRSEAALAQYEEEMSILFGPDWHNSARLPRV